MSSLSLAPYQRDLIQRPPSGKIYLQGPAGSGKTTTGAQRLVHLIQTGISASSILVIVPQRTLAHPYNTALHAPELSAGTQATILTVGGLARRMTDLFWPIVAEEAGFARPDLPPSFLTLETALYYMAYLVRPLLDQGLFDSVTIDRNRIYSQIIDNLNKSAIVGFSYTQIGELLRQAWPASTEQSNIFRDAQRCATLFREYCLQNNLLDFSLQIEIFNHHLWPSDLCQAYLKDTYSHLIVDNLEEDYPIAHDLLHQWLPDFESAFLISDQDAGYRRFLGADPISAEDLIGDCDEYHIFTSSFVTPPVLSAFCSALGRSLERPDQGDAQPLSLDALHSAIDYLKSPVRFFPQMLDWVVDQVNDLIQNGTPPSEIVILAPLLPDALRFALANRLDTLGIPYRSHRPSRALRDESAAQSLLALAALAHPQWNVQPARFELAYALIQSIEGLDLVRAQLLVDAVYQVNRDSLLLPFDQVKPEMQLRITYTIGNRYEQLRRWLFNYNAQPEAELDFFFNRLFGELLSQPGFGFHGDYDAGQISANLIESAQKFRWAVEGRLPALEDPHLEEDPLGKEYMQMISEGILAAQYIQSWQIPPDNAVLLAPAYTFLLANQPVDHQFWLDVGSNAWFERLYQPLTHPHILTRQWPAGQLWTDVEEYELNRDSLYRLVTGLTRRCRKQIHLGLSNLNEGGYESKGMLLRAINHVIAQARGVVP